MKFYQKRKVITRGDENEYLIRYSIFSCPWFAVKIHNILKSDDTCLHDHPWAFISIILKGGYVEESQLGVLGFIKTGTKTVKRLHGAGSILYRPAHYAHRLEVYQSTWTFVITFRKIKEWGFFTPGGWVPHFRHTKRNVCE